MELISREKVIEEIVSTESEVAKNSPFDREWFSRLADRQNEIIEIIENATIVESRPIGKWIIERGCEEVIVTCSNCGAKDYIPTTKDGRFYFNRNYCWDCGADMRGEE